jgi:hypothetical protein
MQHHSHHKCLKANIFSNACTWTNAIIIINFQCQFH